MRTETMLGKYIIQLHADGRSPHTIEQIERHIRLLSRWLVEEGVRDDVRKLHHETIARFLSSDAARLRPDGQPKLETSTNALRSSMRTFFGYCHAAGFTSRNAAALVRRARIGPRPPRALTEGETKRLVAALNGATTEAERRDRALFLTMLSTGIRIGSALAARIDDLDLEAGVLHLTQMKSGGQLTVPIDSETQELLAEYVAERPAGPLFPSRYGRTLTRRAAAQRFDGWREKAGIRRHCSPHSLRHTRATRLYEATGDLLAVQRALGHASIMSSAIYAQGAARQ